MSESKSIADPLKDLAEQLSKRLTDYKNSLEENVRLRMQAEILKAEAEIINAKARYLRQYNQEMQRIKADKGPAPDSFEIKLAKRREDFARRTLDRDLKNVYGIWMSYIEHCRRNL